MQKTNVYRLISLSLLINIIPLKAKQEGLAVVNDTSLEVMIQYRLKDGVLATKRLAPGKAFTFWGRAKISHYNSHYSLIVPKSRSASLLKKVGLKEIMKAARQQIQPYGGKGKIGDIEVSFIIIKRK